MDNVTVIVPVSSESRDIDLFLKILQPSFARVNYKKIVISNESFGDMMDDEIIDRGGCYSGWFYQQLIKIFISQHVSTDWYLCLDSDCFFTGFKTMFEGNKPKLNIEKYPNMETGCHEGWWVNSSKFLKKSIPETWCGVTPMFIHTETMKKLSESYTVNSIRDAINNGCTEYTLYWTFFSSLFNYKDLYSEVPLSYGIYDRSYGDIDKSQELMNYTFPHFMSSPVGLIQSTLHYDVDGLAKNLSHLWN